MSNPWISLITSEDLSSRSTKSYGAYKPAAKLNPTNEYMKLVDIFLSLIGNHRAEIFGGIDIEKGAPIADIPQPKTIQINPQLKNYLNISPISVKRLYKIAHCLMVILVIRQLNSKIEGSTTTFEIVIAPNAT